MKSSEEMINSLLSRRDEYIKAQHKRNKTVLKTAVITAVCLAAAGAGIWSASLRKPGMAVLNSTPKTSDNTAATESSKGSEEQALPDERIIWANSGNGAEAGTYVTDDVYQAIDEGFTEWEGKIGVSYPLYRALLAAEDSDILAILARPRVDYEFEYEGKTLAEYYTEMCYERNLPEILAQLLKEGDSLKYGAALYETGTPDGEKWAQSFYEERIKYYGDDLLAKYIKDGIFLKEKLDEDIKTAGNITKAADAYTKAYEAYLSVCAAAVNGERPSETDVKRNGIIIFLTRDGFRDFTTDDIDGWGLFDLAVKDLQDEAYTEPEAAVF